MMLDKQAKHSSWRFRARSLISKQRFPCRCRQGPAAYEFRRHALIRPGSQFAFSNFAGSLWARTILPRVEIADSVYESGIFNLVLRSMSFPCKVFDASCESFVVLWEQQFLVPKVLCGTVALSQMQKSGGIRLQTTRDVKVAKSIQFHVTTRVH